MCIRDRDTKASIPFTVTWLSRSSVGLDRIHWQSIAAAWNGILLALNSDSWESVTARHPGQVATQNVDSERGSHEDGAYPETPVTMHTPPVRPWIGFASAVTVSFGVVLVSSHCFSISDEDVYKRQPVSASQANAEAIAARDLSIRASRLTPHELS